ncbi:response regulator [Paenibacillus thalictri]|uniref:Response regulator n=1 Tax=Paenibacillus thalictri TaxID=2527873 RepID=A0A4Q9DNS3_9BACL|nr:response regulator [Paenibacillus thalictri]TBL74551.1 response regulator [Paenibacillus thalictri]
MKLIIVEDEPHVRERIAEDIDWDAHRIDMVAAVRSAKEALAIMQKDNIDLVLTDIYMPEMSGLELAKRIKSDFPFVKTLILTGYDDFEYARESIEYGVFKYLVKPAENELILEAVLEAREVREKELAEKINLHLLERRWKEHLPHLESMFYKNWMYGRYSHWEIERIGNDLQLALHDKKHLIVVLDMDPIADGNGRFQAGDRQLVQFSLFTIARDLLGGLDCVVLQDDDGMTALLFSAPLAEREDVWHAKVNLKVSELLETAKDCLKLTASAGIGPAAANFLLLPQAFKQSKMALQARITLGSGIAIPYREPVPAEPSWVYMEQAEKELEVAIETGDGPKCRELIRTVMELGFSEARPVADAKETLWRIACLLARIVHTHGWTLREALQEDFADFERFHELLSRDQIEAWFGRMALRISKTIEQRRQSGT